MRNRNIDNNICGKGKALGTRLGKGVGNEVLKYGGKKIVD